MLFSDARLGLQHVNDAVNNDAWLLVDGAPCYRSVWMVMTVEEIDVPTAMDFWSGRLALLRSLHVASKSGFRPRPVAHQDRYRVRVAVHHPSLDFRLRGAPRRVAATRRVGHQCFRLVPTSIVHIRLLLLALSAHRQNGLLF
jgi:hypothetical protein